MNTHSEKELLVRSPNIWSKYFFNYTTEVTSISPSNFKCTFFLVFCFLSQISYSSEKWNTGISTNAHVKQLFWEYMQFMCYCDQLSLSCVQLFATPCTEAQQASLCMHGIFQQEYWSGLPFLTSGDLPHPGTETSSLVSSALAGGFFITAPHGSS